MTAKIYKETLQKIYKLEITNFKNVNDLYNEIKKIVEEILYKPQEVRLCLKCYKSYVPFYKDTTQQKYCSQDCRDFAAYERHKNKLNNDKEL